MIKPQAAIFNSDNSEYYYYLEYKLKPNIVINEVCEALKKVIDPKETNQVVAFGKKLWKTLSPQNVPDQLTDFNEMHGVNNTHCPSTQNDLFIWLHSEGLDGHSYNFDQVLNIQNAISSIADNTLDLMGFKYKDSRDLTGFVDGSANPKEDDRFQVALIPDGEIGAGGSYILTQKWVHQLNKFHERPEKEQEQIIGRTKADSIELTGDAMPHNSHVSRTDVKVNGVAQKVYRRSAPFGNTQESGLYFLSFASEQSRHQVQLDHMFGLTDDKVLDRLLEFSTPVTSSYWFAPSQTDLEKALK